MGCQVKNYAKLDVYISKNKTEKLLIFEIGKFIFLYKFLILNSLKS